MTPTCSRWLSTMAASAPSACIRSANILQGYPPLRCRTRISRCSPKPMAGWSATVESTEEFAPALEQAMQHEGTPPAPSENRRRISHRRRCHGQRVAEQISAKSCMLRAPHLMRSLGLAVTPSHSGLRIKCGAQRSICSRILSPCAHPERGREGKALGSKRFPTGAALCYFLKLALSQS